MIESLPTELRKILDGTPAFKNVCIVGGVVRDYLLHSWGRLDQEPKDTDVEVYGMDYDDVIAALQPWGKVDMVGKAFGVIKLFTESGRDYDFSIPRRESKEGAGHKGFKVAFDPTITPKEAAARRDFSFNSLAFDYHRRELLDFFNGVEDLRNGVLRHTSGAFAEDPLRVLRGLQFCGRYNLAADAGTVALCRSMKPGYQELPVERVREEWLKWAKLSQKPSAGLHFLRQTEWIDFFPELKALIDVPQEPEWHPEGDVWIHTLHCCDAMATIPEWKREGALDRATHMLAILCHDLAKPQCTAQLEKNGVLRWTAYGHEEAGGPIAQAFLEKLQMPQEVILRVVPLVMDHLAHITTKTDRSIRRLAKRLHPENLDGLWLVMAADHMGRPPLPQVIPQRVTDLRDRARSLGVDRKPPEPFLMGRDLVAMGMKPGKEMGEILKRAYEAQLDGEIISQESALAWFKTGAATNAPVENKTAPGV